MRQIWFLLFFGYVIFGEYIEASREPGTDAKEAGTKCKDRTTTVRTLLGGLLLKMEAIDEENLQAEGLSNSSCVEFAFRHPVLVKGWKLRGREGGMFGPVAGRRGFVASYEVSYLNDEGQSVPITDPKTNEEEFVSTGNLAQPEKDSVEELQEQVKTTQLRISPIVWSGVPYMDVQLNICANNKDLTKEQKHEKKDEQQTVKNVKPMNASRKGGISATKSEYEGQASEDIEKSPHLPYSRCDEPAVWRYAAKITPVDQFSAGGNPDQAWRAILGVTFAPYIFPSTEPGTKNNPLLEIIFRQKSRIDALKIAGRGEDGAEDEGDWGVVTKFLLLYKYPKTKKWVYNSDSTGKARVFTIEDPKDCNNANETSVFHLPTPVNADALGIVPLKWANKPYLALDLLACYTSPPGKEMGIKEEITIKNETSTFVAETNTPSQTTLQSTQITKKTEEKEAPPTGEKAKPKTGLQTSEARKQGKEKKTMVSEIEEKKETGGAASEKSLKKKKQSAKKSKSRVAAKDVQKPNMKVETVQTKKTRLPGKGGKRPVTETKTIKETKIMKQPEEAGKKPIMKAKSTKMTKKANQSKKRKHKSPKTKEKKHKRKKSKTTAVEQETEKETNDNAEVKAKETTAKEKKIKTKTKTTTMKKKTSRERQKKTKSKEEIQNEKSLESKPQKSAAVLDEAAKLEGALSQYKQQAQEKKGAKTEQEEESQQGQKVEETKTEKKSEQRGEESAESSGMSKESNTTITKTTQKSEKAGEAAEMPPLMASSDENKSETVETKKKLEGGADVSAPAEQKVTSEEQKVEISETGKKPEGVNFTESVENQGSSTEVKENLEARPTSASLKIEETQVRKNQKGRKKKEKKKRKKKKNGHLGKAREEVKVQERTTIGGVKKGEKKGKEKKRKKKHKKEREKMTVETETKLEKSKLKEMKKTGAEKGVENEPEIEKEIGQQKDRTQASKKKVKKKKAKKTIKKEKGKKKGKTRQAGNGKKERKSKKGKRKKESKTEIQIKEKSKAHENKAVKQNPKSNNLDKVDTDKTEKGKSKEMKTMPKKTRGKKKRQRKAEGKKKGKKNKKKQKLTDQQMSMKKEIDELDKASDLPGTDLLKGTLSDIDRLTKRLELETQPRKEPVSKKTTHKVEESESNVTIKEAQRPPGGKAKKGKRKTKGKKSKTRKGKKGKNGKMKGKKRKRKGKKG